MSNDTPTRPPTWTEEGQPNRVAWGKYAYAIQPPSEDGRRLDVATDWTYQGGPDEEGMVTIYHQIDKYGGATRRVKHLGDMPLLEAIRRWGVCSDWPRMESGRVWKAYHPWDAFEQPAEDDLRRLGLGRNAHTKVGIYDLGDPDKLWVGPATA